jgi:hypothetical protein
MQIVVYYIKMSNNTTNIKLNDSENTNNATTNTDISKTKETPIKKCEWCKERDILPEMNHCNRLYCIAGMNC